MSQLSPLDDQNTGVSTSASVEIYSSLQRVYSGLISLQIDWSYLLAVQGTLRSPLQHHSSKASILLCSTFFMVQLSQPYLTTGQTIALTIWTFVGRAMSLLFNTLSRFAIAFLPRRNGGGNGKPPQYTCCENLMN